MKPFDSIGSVTEWWRQVAYRRNVSVLVDFTSINLGIQRREVHHQFGYWVIGFSRT